MAAPGIRIFVALNWVSSAEYLATLGIDV